MTMRLRHGAGVVIPIWFAVVAIAVLWPLRHSGFVLLLDWTPTPGMAFELSGPFAVHDAPVDAALRLLALAIGAPAVQRLVLFAAIAGAGIAMAAVVPVRWLPARLFAGTLYAVNPYTMTRLAAGHWRILAAVALLPLGARAGAALVRNPTRRAAIKAGLWAAVVGIVSAHLLVAAVLVLLACAAVGSLSGRKSSRVAGAAVIATAVALVASLWWIVPAALVGVPPGGGVETLDTFASRPVDGASVPVSILGLRGFWVAGMNADGPAGWPFVSLGILALAFVGASLAQRDDRGPFSVALIAAAAAAVVFAIGVGSPVLAGAVRAVYRVVPGAALLREPQKLLAIYALALAWLGAVAVAQLGAVRQIWIRSLAALVVLAIAVVPGYEMFNGAEQRVTPVGYPASWEQGARLLAAEDGYTLVLPWKLYVDLPFDPGTRVAQPAGRYFPRTIASQDPQIGGVSPHVDPRRARLDRALEGDGRLAPILVELGFSHVVLVPEPGGRYDRFDRDPGLVPVLRDEYLIIYGVAERSGV